MQPREIFGQLWTLAWDNSPDFEQTSRHAAAIVHRGSVVSLGVNKKKTHPLAKRFSRNGEAIFIHAELDAIVKASKLVDLAECELYVARVRYYEESHKKLHPIWGGSYPCDGCLKAIDAFDISKVHYSLVTPQYDVEKNAGEQLKFLTLEAI